MKSIYCLLAVAFAFLSFASENTFHQNTLRGSLVERPCGCPPLAESCAPRTDSFEEASLGIADEEPAQAVPAPVAVSAEELAEIKKQLLEAAKQAGIDTTRFQSRLEEFEERSLKIGLSKESQASALKAVEQLIVSVDDGPYFDVKARYAIAELILHNIARPTSIDQGNHPTCNVTTLEVYIAARHPDVYAGLVGQIVLTGKWTAASGDSISPPKAALLAGDDEKAFDMDKPAHNKRNHASQIVQMTLVNGVYQSGRFHKVKVNGKEVDTTGWRYVMGPPVKTTFPIPGGGYAYVTDEDRLLDEKGNQVRDSNGKLSISPLFIGDDILSASEMAIGYKMPYLNAPYMIQGQPWVYDLPSKETLLKYKQDGKFPLGVHTSGGNHVQTIHDVFVAKNGTCWVWIDNQRGEKEDGWITLAELHSSQKSASYKLKPRQKIP